MCEVQLKQNLCNFKGLVIFVRGLKQFFTRVSILLVMINFLFRGKTIIYRLNDLLVIYLSLQFSDRNKYLRFHYSFESKLVFYYIFPLLVKLES